MSEIGVKPELWYSSRYFGMVSLVVFVFYNVTFLYKIDMMLIFPKEDPNNPNKQYYSLMKFALGLVIPDVSWFCPSFGVACCELGLLCLLLLRALWNLGKVLFAKDEVKWDGVVNLCWEDLPELSVFSCIKMLQYIVPQVLTYDLNYILWYEWSPVKLATFIFTRAVVFVVGLDCFLVKIRAATIFIDQDDPSSQNVIGAIVLLVNILGVVQIGKTVKNRLYRFVFGGEDGIMDPSDQVRKDVWEAMVAQRIFEKYPIQKALALMLTWCDDDFQMLTLDEKKII